MTDFKHVEEQIAFLAMEPSDRCNDCAHTMQALLDVARVAERLSLTGTHQYDLDEELLRALAKLQEQKQTLQECLQEELDELRAEQTKLQEQNDD